ncbi:hypothetical protein UP10_31625 [Bradyrhizobium sp. LTSPM299]|nr:hypothetical protein UP10_31625 [Bradyrhizobium sp. LTSPM299]
MIPCPFCRSENPDNALVCINCARDIALPATLLAERDDLLRKRDVLREELRCAKQEIEIIMNRRRSR